MTEYIIYFLNSYIYIYIVICLIICILTYFIYKKKVDSTLYSAKDIQKKCDREEGVIEDVTTRYNLLKNKHEIDKLKNDIKVLLIILISLCGLIFLIANIISLNKEENILLVFLIVYLAIFISILDKGYYETISNEENSTKTKDEIDSENEIKNKINDYKNALDKCKNKDTINLEKNGKDFYKIDNLQRIIDEKFVIFDHRREGHCNTEFKYMNLHENNENEEIEKEFKKMFYGEETIWGRQFDILWIFITIMIVLLIGIYSNISNIININELPSKLSLFLSNFLPLFEYLPYISIIILLLTIVFYVLYNKIVI